MYDDLYSSAFDALCIVHGEVVIFMSLLVKCCHASREWIYCLPYFSSNVYFDDGPTAAGHRNLICWRRLRIPLQRRALIDDVRALQQKLTFFWADVWSTEKFSFDCVSSRHSFVLRLNHSVPLLMLYSAKARTLPLLGDCTHFLKVEIVSALNFLRFWPMEKARLILIFLSVDRAKVMLNFRLLPEVFLIHLLAFQGVCPGVVCIHYIEKV